MSTSPLGARHAELTKVLRFDRVSFDGERPDLVVGTQRSNDRTDDLPLTRTRRDIPSETP